MGRDRHAGASSGRIFPDLDRTRTTLAGDVGRGRDRDRRAFEELIPYAQPAQARGPGRLGDR